VAERLHDRAEQPHVILALVGQEHAEGDGRWRVQKASLGDLCVPCH